MSSKITFDTREFKRLRSWGWRRKGVKQKQGIARNLHRASGGRDFVRIEHKPGFNTGCWAYTGGEHLIRIGDGFVDGLTPASQAKQSHVREAYQSLLRHECWHGFATSRTKDIAAELREEGIPFSLYNLFEDARIEHLARTCTDPAKDEGGRFRWQNWEEFPSTELDVPVHWFHLLVWREASAYKALTAAEAGYKWIGVPTVRVSRRSKGQCTRRVIRKFYTRAIAARESIDLLPIIKEWVEIFGTGAPNGPRTSEEIDGEKIDGTSGESGIKLNEDSGEKGTSGDLTSEELEANPDTGLSASETEGIKPFEYHWKGNKHRTKWDEAKVRRIVNRLTQLTASAALDRDELGSNGTRIHLPGIVAQSSNFTRRTTEINGPRTITVIVDCSSSMFHTWADFGGLDFVIALRRLHVRGVLDVRLWLTGSGRCFKVPLHRISERQLSEITPCRGSESFAHTLRTAAKDVQESSVTIAWTDGMITDGDVDSRALRQKGVDIIGCAPRDPSDTAIRNNILRHFGKGFLGEAEQLARHIAHYVLNRD